MTIILVVCCKLLIMCAICMLTPTCNRGLLFYGDVEKVYYTTENTEFSLRSQRYNIEY